MKDILALKKMEKMDFKHFVRSVMQKEREHRYYRGKTLDKMLSKRYYIVKG